MDRYDAGLLNDWGGGNVDWWWDYIRSELDAAHQFYEAMAEDEIKKKVNSMVATERKKQQDRERMQRKRESDKACLDRFRSVLEKISGGEDEEEVMWNGQEWIYPQKLAKEALKETMIE